MTVVAPYIHIGFFQSHDQLPLATLHSKWLEDCELIKTAHLTECYKYSKEVVSVPATNGTMMVEVGS